jgi:ubiquinol-cytochrome c reductase cytochrome b subunit
MFAKIGRWIAERWPLEAFLRLSLEEEMPGGTSYAYVFGSSVFIVFLLQVITGVWQLLYFVPMIDRAYDSLNFLRIEVPFGWLIHGLHYWGASAMIILVGLHISQVFVWGAYKNPRQLTWLIGVAQLVLTLALGFTGPVLPWDERGYWEAEVAVSSAGTVPLLGSLARNLLSGGSALGQMTLSRFFFLHVAILPAILLTMIGLHLVAFRKAGISGPWDVAKRQRTGPFWPDQVFKDAIVVTGIFVILVGLAAFFKAPFSGPLDIMETFYVPRPEWYFLFFYQTLKAFHGWLEPIGTIGVPLLLTLFFLLLPFVDRKPERNPARRPTAMACFFVFVGWVIAMAAIGAYSAPPGGVVGGRASSLQSARTAPPPQIASPAKNQGTIKQGEQFFNSLGCIGCHSIKGRGGVIGPPLTPQLLQDKTKQWLVTQIRNPKAHNPSTIMPAFSSASDPQVNDVVDFLLSVARAEETPPGQAAPLSAPAGKAAPASPSPLSPSTAETAGPQGPPEAASFVIGNVDLGTTIFHQSCEPCHGPRGAGKVPNPGSTEGAVPPLKPIDPELFGRDAQTFVNKIDPYIQHGSIPAGPNPALRMLPFGDSESLTQQMIANVEAYVLYLNGIDRAEPVHPGLEPRSFFWLVVSVFAVVLGWFWV